MPTLYRMPRGPRRPSILSQNVSERRRTTAWEIIKRHQIRGISNRVWPVRPERLDHRLHKADWMNMSSLQDCIPEIRNCFLVGSACMRGERGGCYKEALCSR